MIMNRLSRSSITVAVVAALSIFFSDCATAPVVKEPISAAGLTDGIYEGTYSSWPNKAAVLVTVKDGRIAGIDITSHWASGIGKKAEPVIRQRIIEKQSTNVDALSGATNSSRVIMQAVQDALEKAYAGNVRMKEKE